MGHQANYMQLLSPGAGAMSGLSHDGGKGPYEGTPWSRLAWSRQVAVGLRLRWTAQVMKPDTMLDGDWSLAGLEHSRLVRGLIGDRAESRSIGLRGLSERKSQVDRPKWRLHSHPAVLLASVKPSTQLPRHHRRPPPCPRASSSCCRPQHLLFGRNCDPEAVAIFTAK